MPYPRSYAVAGSYPKCQGRDNLADEKGSPSPSATRLGGDGRGHRGRGHGRPGDGWRTPRTGKTDDHRLGELLQWFVNYFRARVDVDG